MDAKKVLIISYVWPPMEGVGSFRAMKFAKYLTRFGWLPIVMTVKPVLGDPSVCDIPPAGVKVLRTDYRDVIGGVRKFLRRPQSGQRAGDISGRRPPVRGLGRISSLIRETLSMPDEQIGWYEFAVRDGKALIDSEKIDLVFSTSPPETSHLIARTIKKQRGIPWVADLRDLWSGDHFRQRPALKRLALKVVEANVLKDADRIITVSDPWAEALRASIGGKRDRIRVIENGFDEEDYRPEGFQKNEKFTLTYTGKLHRIHQDVTILFKALADTIREGAIDPGKIEIRFYALGYDRPDIAALAGSYGLSGIVRDIGKISYEDAAAAQRRSDALLFVQWRGRGKDGWYSAKIYDYIGARRPILSIAEKGGLIDGLIKRTSSGIVAHDEEGVKNGLKGLYNEFLRDGTPGYGGDEAEIARLSRRHRAKELSELFDALVRK